MAPIHGLNLDADFVESVQLERAASALELLAAYAIAKASAVRARQSGVIDYALQCEARCKWYYDQLPAEWRW